MRLRHLLVVAASIVATSLGCAGAQRRGVEPSTAAIDPTTAARIRADLEFPNVCRPVPGPYRVLSTTRLLHILPDILSYQRPSPPGYDAAAKRYRDAARVAVRGHQSYVGGRYTLAASEFMASARMLVDRPPALLRQEFVVARWNLYVNATTAWMEAREPQSAREALTSARAGDPELAAALGALGARVPTQCE